MITESKFLQLESLQELMKVQSEEGRGVKGLAGSGRGDGDSGVCLSFCQGWASGWLLLHVYFPAIILLQALVSVTPDEETYDEEDAAFCLEMLLRIVLENR